MKVIFFTALAIAITELDLSYLYFARRCPAGSGRPLDAKEKCSKRVVLEPHTETI